MVNQYQRAAIAWPVLAETAAKRSKITYVQLAQHLGIHPRPIRYVLAVIQDHCLKEKLPPLTILVVNQRGRPGEGFIAWDVDRLDDGYPFVYAYPWHQLPTRSPSLSTVARRTSWLGISSGTRRSQLLHGARSTTEESPRMCSAEPSCSRTGRAARSAACR